MTNVSTLFTDLGTGLGSFFDSIGPALGGFIAIIGIVMAIVYLIRSFGVGIAKGDLW
jgi:hypothetical protein